MARRLAALGRKERVPGFRTGKAPAAVLARRFGERVRQEVEDRLAAEALREVLARQELWPVTVPALERQAGAAGAAGSPSTRFASTFDVFPRLPAIDLEGLTIARPVPAITGEDVDEMLARLRAQRRTWRPADRSAREGDLLCLDLWAEGPAGSVPPRGARREEAVIGEAGTWQALAARLAGRRVGETVEADLEAGGAPAPFDRAGSPCRLSLRLAEVREPVLPELDAAFVRVLGVADGTVEALRNRLRRTMEEELAEAVDAELERRVEAALVALHPDIAVPEMLAEAEAGPWRAACLFFEIARQNGIRPAAGAVLARIEEQARATDDPQQAIDQALGDGALYREVEEEVLRRQVVAFVLERAEVEDVPARFVDFARPATRNPQT